jgi:hypothetical protein
MGSPEGVVEERIGGEVALQGIVSPGSAPSGRCWVVLDRLPWGQQAMGVSHQKLKTGRDGRWLFLWNS